MIKFLKSKYIIPSLVIFIFVVYLLLVWKNPFASQSLVSNLEPYPDTLFYSYPAWSYIHGTGFSMQAFDYQTKIITPPLYSIYLLPFFALFQNVQSFYIANIILGLCSLGIFLTLAYKIFQGKYAILITVLLGILFVTNYFIYTIPWLLLAENITLSFSLLGLYLLYEKPTSKKSILAGLVAISLVAIKFSNLSFTLSLIILYGLKIWQCEQKKQFGIRFLVTIILGGIILSTYILLSGILIGHKNINSSTGFSFKYFIPNVHLYLSSLFGNPGKFLWFNIRFISLLVSGLACIGTIFVIINKEYRKRILPLILYAFSVFLFMPFFYTNDVRYISPLIPVIVILSGFTFVMFQKKIGSTVNSIIIIFIMIFYFTIPQFGYIPTEQEFITIKKQIGLNLRHAEIPWNYLAVQSVNTFIKKNDGKKPYMGMFLPPYYVKIFANGNYNYLPIASSQEFISDNKKLTLEYKKSLPLYYEKLLREGDTIYITDYYSSNLSTSWKPAFEEYKQKFILNLVQSGCYNTCNLYEVKLKE